MTAVRMYTTTCSRSNNRMKKTYKIVIDTKGADAGVDVMLRGAKRALDTHRTLSFLLVGDAAELMARCASLGLSPERVELLDATQEITGCDSPVAALFEKRDSSLVRAFEALSERDELSGLIGAGNTGALLAASLRFLAREDRARPALAALLPSEQGGFTCLVDAGASVDCDPHLLLHFARLGSDFMRRTYHMDAPRVGLLSSGREASKGNKTVKETHLLLETSELNFIGNIEGDHALSGECDVLVADGFAGNQVLKVTEGTARRLMKEIAAFAEETKSEDARRLYSRLMQSYDITSLGGAVVLGVTKPVIKTHGACNENSVAHAVDMILNMLENKKIFESKENTSNV